MTLVILYVLNLTMSRTHIEVGYEYMPVNEIKFILNGSNHLYAGPTVEFPASKTRKACPLLVYTESKSTLALTLISDIAWASHFDSTTLPFHLAEGSFDQTPFKYYTKTMTKKSRKPKKNQIIVESRV